MKQKCKRCDNAVCSQSKCHCVRHLEDQRRYNDKFRATRYSSGVCVRCGNTLSSRSKRLCDFHLKDQEQKHADWKVKSGYKQKLSKYQKLKLSAKIRKIEFNISEFDFSSWFNCQERVCYYCGVDEDCLKRVGRAKGFLSIDRKDNSLGYCMGNICLACMRCNNLKSNFFFEEEWIEICDRFVKPRLNQYHSA